MNRIFIGLYLAATLVYFLPKIGAQDVEAADEDIFDTEAFDISVGDSRATEVENRVKYLIGGSLLFDSISVTTVEFDNYSTDWRFSGRFFAKVSFPEIGFFYISYLLDHTIFQGTTVKDGTPSGDDLLSPRFDLSEFYLSFDLAKTIFFRIGNQLISWGPSAIWTPVDSINIERSNPLENLDRRTGKPSIRLHVPFSWTNFFAIGDFSGTVGLEDESLVVNNPAETINLGARWDVTLLGFELGFTGFLGYSIQNRYGFDFSGRLLGFDLYGELAMEFAYSDYDFGWAFSTGTQRSFGELQEWGIQGEVFYNSRGEENEDGYQDLIFEGTFTPLYVGMWYAFASISKQNLVGSFLDASLSGFMNLSDISYTTQLSTAIDIPRFIPFTVAVSLAGGGEDREFTLLNGNNALSVSLQTRLSF